MSRTAINFVLDSCLFVVFVTTLWTSALLQFIFPPATQADGWSLWGVGYDGWHRVQTGCLIVFSLAVLLHLVLHWTWVCGFISGRLTRMLGRPVTTNEATRTIYGVATLTTVLLIGGTLLLLGQIRMQNPGSAAPNAESSGQILEKPRIAP